MTYGILVEVKAQIELGDLQVKMKPADLEVANSRDCRQRLQRPLKDRVSARVTFNCQMPQHGFKRYVAMGERVERRVPAPPQQLHKGRIIRKVATQGDHVEKIFDQRLNLAGGSRGERCSHNDFFRVRVPVKQSRKTAAGS